MNKKTKNNIECMMKKIDWSDVNNDKANLSYLTDILHIVIDMNEKDRKYFDEHYAFTKNFNMHGYGTTANNITFSSNGIKIWNNDEDWVREHISFTINEGHLTDKDDIIEVVADEIADQFSYENEFDRVLGENRDNRIHNHYYKYYKKIAKKILNVK